MSKGLPVYSALTRLYPAGFLREFGSDLVQNFDDLLVTVPRYRLESVMSAGGRSELTLAESIACDIAQRR